MSESNTPNDKPISDATRLVGKTCEESAYHGYGYNRHHGTCGKPAKAEIGGRFYCGVHNPQRADRVAKQKEKEDQFRRASEYRKRESRCIAACEGVPTEQLEKGLLARLLEERK